ncbi:MAG TPA: T9SS type A sorting domain-containing protein [Draconibacterium sp.]|nr:T9SS type A sorting domain-containing protein [Draconibacterium sp.]HRX10117.1 T9SS type A sorting domain-containing protein [Draconibacterium sp.]
MKKQQAQIEELKNDLADCCETSLKSGSITGFDDLEVSGNQARLYQNNPNPFSTQTNIKFEIPETAQNAQLHICNMTGTLLKTITLTKRGNGNETINANEFVAGMYLYSLVCDGKIVDTKQMLLTE